MSDNSGNGLITIFTIVLGFILWWCFRPLSFFLLTLGAFMLPGGLKYLCLIPLLLFLIRYIRLKDTRSLIIFGLSIIPALSMGGHEVWNQTTWGKKQTAERAAQPVILTPSQQAGLAAAREIKDYLIQAKATAQAADKALDRGWPALAIDQACRLTLKFQAEKSKKYTKLSEQEITTWNNRIKSVENAVRDFAATASKMESDMRAIVAKHFPPEALEGDITPFATTIDPFRDIPRRTEEMINAKFVDYPKWTGDAQFSALAFTPGEPEAIRKAKGDKFCDSFQSHGGIGSQLIGAINRALAETDAEIARLDPPKPTKKFNLNAK